MADVNDQADIITVGKRNDDNRAVWDRHPFHPSNYGQPEGEVFFSDMRPYEVHRSAGINQKIREGEIRELGDRETAERRKLADRQAAEAEERRQELADRREQVPAHAVYVQPPVDPQPPMGGGYGAAPDSGLTPEQRMTTTDDDEETTEEPDPTESGPHPSTRRVTRPSGRGRSAETTEAVPPPDR